MMWGLPAPLPAEHDQHGVVLILAFYTLPMGTTTALFVCDDGQLRTDVTDHLKVEWRFNWATHTWEDTDSGDLYDETSDGSPEIPGDVPELDRTDRSDPGDEGDGATGGVGPE